MSKPMNICMDCVNNFFDKKKNRYYCADKKTRIEDVPCESFEQRCDDDIDSPWYTGVPTEEGWYVCITSSTECPYHIAYFKYDHFFSTDQYFIIREDVKAWMPIPPYETKPHITKLPKEWYDPKEDDWYKD